MELFVMRHGDALFRASQDHLRELSPVGKEQVAEAIAADAGPLSACRRLLVSPYLRARQTADIICRLLPAIEREQCQQLVPGANPQALIDFLYQRYHGQQQDSLLLVSHLPLVADFLDSLCGSARGSHNMATASLAAVEFETLATGCGQMRWLHHPQHRLQ